jgi:hypothetical protein
MIALNHLMAKFITDHKKEICPYTPLPTNTVYITPAIWSVPDESMKTPVCGADRALMTP